MQNEKSKDNAGVDPLCIFRFSLCIVPAQRGMPLTPSPSHREKVHAAVVELDPQRGALPLQAEAHQRFATASRIAWTAVAVGVPGRKIPLMPRFRSFATSCSGMIPPAKTGMSDAP